MLSIDLEKSIQRKDNMSWEVVSLSSSLADLYAPSPMVESLKMNIYERDKKIKDINNELLHN
jgi:hypothetical protein